MEHRDGVDDLLKFKPSLRMRRKGDVSDFKLLLNKGMVQTRLV